jgi:hypothetical protein
MTPPLSHRRSRTTRPAGRRREAVASSVSAPRLLPAYLVAVSLTVSIACMMLLAMQRSAPFDLTGQVETLLPLAKLSVFAAPLIVAARAAGAAITVWLVAGALNEPLPLRTIAATIVLWIPLLELSALVDGVAILLDPQRGWNQAHIALGLDALLPQLDGSALIAARLINLPWLAFTLVLWRQLRTRHDRSDTVAVPAALAASLLLVLLPLLQR